MTDNAPAELVEIAARIIDPSSWAVMDSYLAETKRKYRGQNVGWPADQFHHKESMAKARAVLAAVIPQIEAHAREEGAKAMQWQDIATAPRDGRYIVAARFRNGNELCWVQHSRWITVAEIIEIEGGDEDDWDAGWTQGDQDDEPIYPTHWQPLPEPPTIDPAQIAGGKP